MHKAKHVSVQEQGLESYQKQADSTLQLPANFLNFN